MKNVFKWTGIVLGGLIALVLLAYGYIYYQTDSRFNKEYEVRVQPIAIPSDPASLALSAY